MTLHQYDRIYLKPLNAIINKESVLLSRQLLYYERHQKNDVAIDVRHTYDNGRTFESYNFDGCALTMTKDCVDFNRIVGGNPSNVIDYLF